MRSFAVALLLALAGCVGAATGPAALEQEIIGGTTDSADSGVVLIYMTIPGQQGGALCTGEAISPHVVLTAAHCAGGEDPTVTNAVWRIYLGNDFSKATTADLLAVKEAHYDPQFDINNLPVATTWACSSCRTRCRRRWRRSSSTARRWTRASTATASASSATGSTTAPRRPAPASSARRRRRSTDHTPLILHFSDGTHETCNGDSGGPAFMTVGGKEVIVGLTSYGDVNCNMGGYDTRVDAYAAFIDGYVSKADPGFVNGSTGGMGPPSSTPPSPSGGTQTPPTSSAPPMPPSSAGSGGVGASCVSDNDCQSHLCGLANNGTRICFAANANNVQGGIGCAMARGDHDTTTGAALLFVVIALIARRRMRS